MNKRNILKAFFAFLLIACCLFSFVGCKSSNEGDELVKRSFNYEIGYDQTSECSYVTFSVAFDNRSINDIKAVNFTIMTIRGGAISGTYALSCELDSSNHSSVHTETFAFKANELVQSVFIYDYDLTYASFGETYTGILVASTTSILLTIAIYILVVALRKLTFSQVVSYFCHRYIYLLFPVAFLGLFIYVVFSNLWIETVILSTGAICFALTPFIHH